MAAVTLTVSTADVASSTSSSDFTTYSAASAFPVKSYNTPVFDGVKMVASVTQILSGLRFGPLPEAATNINSITLNVYCNDFTGSSGILGTRNVTARLPNAASVSAWSSTSRPDTVAGAGGDVINGVMAVGWKSFAIPISTWKSYGAAAGSTFAILLTEASSGASDAAWTAVTNVSLASGYLPYVTIDYGAAAAPTTAPTTLQFTSTTGTGTTLMWTGVAGATSYTIERSTDNATWGNSTTSASTSLVVSGLASSTTYYFRVKGTNTTGSGPWSALTNNSVTTGIAPPGAPGVPSYSDVTNTSVILTWSSATGATSYDVSRSSSQDTGYVVVGVGVTSPWMDNGLSKNTTYYYRVAGKNAGGTGSASQGAAVTTLNMSASRSGGAFNSGLASGLSTGIE